MTTIGDIQIDRVRDLVFREGRLLERKLFEHFFEGGSRQACLKALAAYQNADGGFGNGIEPDLLCPDSTAIGAETALYILDLLESGAPDLTSALVHWILGNQDETGAVPHPPAGILNYPHQPWWENPDPSRVLVLAGLLRKRGISHDLLLSRARTYFARTALPGPDSFYGYSHYAYLKYCAEGQGELSMLSTMLETLPALLETHRSHFPLFSRYWYYAAEDVEPATLGREAERFVAALQEDGGVPNPYPELPWWRPMFTLDGMILLRKAGLP